MILYIADGITRIALRIKQLGGRSQLISWHNLRMIVHRGQLDCNPCFAGTRLIFTGCWPTGRTNVDVANCRPHVPPFFCDAFELDQDGRVVFRLGDHFSKRPYGRYTAIVIEVPPNKKPVTPFNLLADSIKKTEENNNFNCIPDEPVMHIRHPKPCVLAEFEIDYGPKCHDHIIDQVVYEHALNTCGED